MFKKTVIVCLFIFTRLLLLAQNENSNTFDKDYIRFKETLDKELINSSIADKIVGMAASMLFVYAKVSAVFTQLISDPGLKILQENNIASQFEKRVPNILNHRQNDVCPFEKQAIASKTVEEAYHNLRSFANQKKLKKR